MIGIKAHTVLRSILINQARKQGLITPIDFDPKLKLVLINQLREKGFVTPMILSLGMVTLLVGTTMMVRSQAEEIQSKQQKQTHQVFSVAEVGITRYQQLIKNYSAIAAYPDCSQGRDTNNQCLDTSADVSWSNPSSILPDDSFCDVSYGAVSEAEGKVSSLANLDLQNIDPNDANPLNGKGQYRLVSYEYNPSTATSGIGTLIVEGRLKEAIKQIKVEIPVERSTNIGANTTTGIWIRSNLNSTISGSGQIQGHIKDSTCSDDVVTANVENLQTYQQEPYVTNGETYTYNATPGQSFPSLPNEGASIPTGAGVNILYQIDNSTDSLPRAGDVEVDNVYTYYVSNVGTSVDLNTGTNLNIDAGAGKTIVLYLEGDMSLAESSSITVAPGTTLIVYAHGAVDLSGGSSDGPIQNNNTPDYAQIYVYEGDNVKLAGGTNMKLFVFAPDSLVEQTGSNQVIGTIWANSWQASGDAKFIEGETNLANIEIADNLLDDNYSIKPVNSWTQVDVK